MSNIVNLESFKLLKILKENQEILSQAFLAYRMGDKKVAKGILNNFKLETSDNRIFMEKDSL